MKSVRIEPVAMGRAALVDVVCDCGENCLRDTDTGETSFKHRIDMDESGQDKILICDGCEKKYRIHPQTGHVHVSNTH